MRTKRWVGPSIRLLVLAMISLAATACEGGSSKSLPPISVKEVHYFSDLAQMVATSDAVVQGTVIETEPGRVVGGQDPRPEGDGAIQFLQVTISIDKVLYGSLPEGSFLVEEDGYNGVPPSEVGDRGFYFVHLKQDETDKPYYRLINSQGRFLVQGERLVGSNDSDSWVQAIEAVSPLELEALVAQAKEAIERGVVTPQPGR
ncbi:MAG: hypothetical protein ACRDIX_09165 [Actinomycetota bacterium]